VGRGCTATRTVRTTRPCRCEVHRAAGVASLERAANAQAIILAVTCHRLTRLRPSGPIAERDQESDGKTAQRAAVMFAATVQTGVRPVSAGLGRSAPLLVRGELYLVQVEMTARIFWVPGAGLPGSWADARSW